MPKGKYLSEEEKGMISAYINCNLSNRAIATKLGRNEKAIPNYRKQRLSISPPKKRGRRLK
ncbi:hypothetical protein L915_08733, partial [Phytophthora nicotianae]